MAKKGDLAQEIFDFSAATASDAHRTLAGFSLRTATGEINICMSFDRLGSFITHALVLAQQHAKALNRKHIPGGATVAAEIIPESVTVSFSDVSGANIPRLVIIIGDLTLAFLVDQELLREALSKFSGPAAPRTDPNRLILHLSIDDDTRELKLPMHCTSISPVEVSMLPVKWAPHVGFITVLWGDFETRMDEITAALTKINNTPPERGTNRHEFIKRRKQFLDETRTAFAKYPNIVRYCEKLIEDAANIHLPRNMIVHGRLHGGMIENEYVLVAELDRKGVTYRANFREPEIVTLYHETANLCGRIGFLRDPDDSPRKPQPFSFEEKQFLRDLKLDNRPNPATPPTHQSPPQSS